MRTVSISIEVTDEIRDATRQAGLEGRLNEWAQGVLQVEAERIVFGPKRVEVRTATDTEQRTALEEAAANLGPSFIIRLVYGSPERPCAMMPIGIQVSPKGPDDLQPAWTDETGCLPALPRNSKILQSIEAFHLGGRNDEPIPFSIHNPEDDGIEIFTINAGPERPKGFKR